MTSWFEGGLVGIILLDLLALGSSRLTVLIRCVAAQGIVIGLLTFIVPGHSLSLPTALLGCGNILLKGFIFPWYLTRALREAEVRREVEPFIGYSPSILCGVLGLGLSLWISRRLPLPPAALSNLLVPASLFTMLSGLFLVITRQKALTQVIGYLALENGIYTFGLAIAVEEPLLVALGVLLDIFVAVFVMGIMIFHISREFDHIDVDRLSTLKDWTRRFYRPSLGVGSRAREETPP